MFRDANVSGPFLGDSECLFAAVVGKNDLDREGLSIAAKNVGFLVRYQEALNNIVVGLKIPHRQADAFAGIWLLNQYIDPGHSRMTNGLEEPLGNILEDLSSQRDLEFYSRTLRISSGSRCQTHCNRSLSQHLIADLLTEPAFAELTVGVTISMDDLRRLDIKHLAGNSFTTVVLSREDLLQLAASSRATWNGTLIKKASQLVHIIKKRRRLIARYPDIVFSSVGDLAKLDWSCNLTPQFMQMIPTPSSREVGNIVFWGNGEIQCFLLCCGKEHPLAKQFARLSEIWENTLKEYSESSREEDI